MAPRSSVAAQPYSNPGYHGRYLRVDLGSARSELVPLDARVLRQFLGGSGLGTWLLLQEGAAGMDPLAPESPLAVVFSPLAGSPLTTSAKFAVVGKSPLTDRINDSLASGRFALAGKRTGCDAIVVSGRAVEPSVLVIDDGKISMEPARGLWGETCDATESRLTEQLGADYQILGIGPAGEKQVRYATVSHAGRHAGRGGSGAVLGAKNLKAIAVRGSQTCRWAHPERLTALARDLAQRSLGPATARYRELGTTTNLLLFNRLGTLPTRNFAQGTFEGAARLSPDAMAPPSGKVRAGCVACTIGCEHRFVPSKAASSDGGVRLEYESLFALGPLCGIEDPDTVLAAVRRCDQLGLDTISAGGTIAFAMECVERGLLDASWLRFGDRNALLRAIDEIGRREGLGRLMAEGSRRMAIEIGSGSMAFAPQVKGLELPGYEPRGLQTLALGLAVGTRGADHNRSGAYEADFSEQVDRRNADVRAASLAVQTEDRAAVMDSLVLCKFLRGVLTDFFAESAAMLHLVTGWDVSADELRATARRIVDVKKEFNIRAGWQPEEDTLPDRFLDNPLPNDPTAVLSRERLQELVRAYNLARDWTEEGWLRGPMS